jgi:AmmeMemoRadiSam system protein B
MAEHKEVRTCAVCGLFYPSDPAALKTEVTGLIGASKLKKGDGRVMGVISPHAGYLYSGSTAASGFALLAGESYDTVVIISPSHRDYFEGVSVYQGDAYRTPMGTVRVDSGLRDRLIDTCDIVVASERGHGEEHAIEVQLPFLQSVIPTFSFLPLVIGHQRRENCFHLGEALGMLLSGMKPLVVASTDLSHYHTSEIAERLDAVVIRRIEQFDPEGLMEDLEEGNTEACGGGPAVAAMVALKRIGARRMVVVRHCNSGDVTGDYSSVVGYLSAVAYG